jgi:hypothetical protein
MSYPGTPQASYEINVTAERGGYPSTRVRTELRLDDVSALPAVVKQLAEWDYDLSDTAKALQEAEEEQRKRKRDELEENRRLALAGREPKSKRLVFVYNKVGKTSVGVAEGVVFSDESIYILNSAAHQFGGRYTNEEHLSNIAKTLGYELFVKRFD